MYMAETKHCNTEGPLLSREEMMDALGLLVRRMDAIDAQLYERLPSLFARSHGSMDDLPRRLLDWRFLGRMVVAASTADRSQLRIDAKHPESASA